MNVIEATVRPWRIYENEVEGIHILAEGAPNEERYIVCEQIDRSADAALIVRSVNNAEKLAEALRRAADDLHESTDDKTSTSACRDGALCYACAALAAWEA